MDILIVLVNLHLVIALEERTGAEDEPHAVYTLLGWITSEGKSPFHIFYHSMRLSVHPDVDATDQKILELQQTIRGLSVPDEAIQLSVCNCKAQQGKITLKLCTRNTKFLCHSRTRSKLFPASFSWPPNASLVCVNKCSKTPSICKQQLKP